MSFGKNKSESSQEFDPELKRALLSVFGEGERLYKNMPYVPYAGARVAPFSNLEMAGQQQMVDRANRGYGIPGMRNAMMATDMGLGFNPRDIRANPITSVPTVSARDVAAQSITPVPTVSARDVAAQSITPVPVVESRDVSANTIEGAPVVESRNIDLENYRLRDTDFQPYMNQYTSSVVDSTLADIERARKMQQNQTAASAVSAGAFGGDRHGLREAATNEAALREVARTTGQLRRQGFDTGTQLASTDIANRLAAQRADQAAALQAGVVNRQTRVDSKKANMMAQLEAELANQRSALDASKTNRLSRVDAKKANMLANLQAQEANQRSDLQGSIVDRQTRVDAKKANMLANLQAQEASQRSDLQGSIVDRQTRVDSKKANMLANLQAQEANQRADVAGFDARQSAARQLAALSGDYRNMMFQDPRVLMQVGGMQREQGQRMLDDVYGRFTEARDYPIRMFDVLRGAAGILPNPLTQQSEGSAFNIGFGKPR